MRNHRKLKAFELSDNLAVQVYKLTKDFPKEEVYTLTSQMRRAAISVPSNIVEGCARESQSEYLRFLEIAFSSLRELHYQITLSNRLGYLEADEFKNCETMCIETEKALGALLRSMRSLQKTEAGC